MWILVRKFSEGFINLVFLNKVYRILFAKADALWGRLYPLRPTLEAMALRPFELHLELTNLCNADCIFCPYQYQTRKIEFMPDEVFYKAVRDYVYCGGGSVGLTPIVGDALIDPKFVERVLYLRSQPSIDRIWVVTNGILLDKHGIAEILNAGLTSITVSTAGFDEAMYTRVYRSNSYQKMKKNVTELVAQNARLKEPLHLTLALRPDRPLQEVLKDPDLQPILAYRPQIDFTWAFGTIGGKIKPEELPQAMKLRSLTIKKESCVNLYNGPIVLPRGEVMACSCVAAMDAVSDLGIGNIMKTPLSDIWKGEQLKQIRASFGTGALNATCSGCDFYRNLDCYRTREGRERARINRARHRGEITFRDKKANAPFVGG